MYKMHNSYFVYFGCFINFGFGDSVHFLRQSARRHISLKLKQCSCMCYYKKKISIDSRSNERATRSAGGIATGSLARG